MTFRKFGYLVGEVYIATTPCFALVFWLSGRYDVATYFIALSCFMRLCTIWNHLKKDE
jgi:hypothetical protein